MTCMFDQVVILSGEIRCLSLLGLKGLTLAVVSHGFAFKKSGNYFKVDLYLSIKASLFTHTSNLQLGNVQLHQLYNHVVDDVYCF